MKAGKTIQHSTNKKGLGCVPPCSVSWELYPASSLNPRGSPLLDLSIALRGLARKGQGVMAARCCTQATDPAPGREPWPLWHPLLTPAALDPVHLHWCSCHSGTSVVATQSLVDWDLLVGGAANTQTEGWFPGLVLTASKRQIL